MISQAMRTKIATDYLRKYVEAQDADMVYTQAIKVQFGGLASRWDHPFKEYNAETRKAYYAKVSADHDLSVVLNLMREHAITIEEDAVFIEEI